MKITIDTDAKRLELSGSESLPLYSPEAFELLSELWLKVGWDQKYSYTFTWMGRPIIQLPEDMIRLQEIIFAVKPDVIIETGVAHGGSLIFSATLCKALDKGRVIGIDIEIRPHNRKALEEHPLGNFITLIEGSSTAPEVIANVASKIQAGDKVLVILDSCHTKSHVADELNCYHKLVTSGSYIIATDGIMGNLSDVTQSHPDWKWNNPTQAAAEFAVAHPEFQLEEPKWLFNESALKKNITYWPGAFLKRK